MKTVYIFPKNGMVFGWKTKYKKGYKDIKIDARKARQRLQLETGNFTAKNAG